MANNETAAQSEAPEDPIIIPRALIGAACYVLRKDERNASLLAKLRSYTTGPNSGSFALQEWFDKTEWVQKQNGSFSFNTLGKHRADVMREEIERLRAIKAPDGYKWDLVHDTKWSGASCDAGTAEEVQRAVTAMGELDRHGANVRAI